MERIYRKGFGFCLISHKSFQTHRIINRSSSVFSVRSVVSSAGFKFNKIFVLSLSHQRFATGASLAFWQIHAQSGLRMGFPKTPAPFVARMPS